MKPTWPDITKIDGEVTAEKLRKQLAEPASRALFQLRAMLGGNLTIRDNMNAAIIEVDCVHGQEVPLPKTTLTGLPVAFTPLFSKLSDGSNALPVMGTPIINYTRDDGLLGLTVRFVPPPGIVSLLRNATQSIPSTNGSVQWDADVFTRTPLGTTVTDGSLSYDITTTSGAPAVNSKINCLAAGIVLVCGQIILSASAGGTDRSVWIQKNNSTSPRWGSVRGGFDAGNSTGLSCAAQIDVVAGDYLQLQAYQNTGAGLNLVSSATIGRPNQIQVRYIAPPVGYTATVTGILWGG